jgi:hypothetical protein
MSQGARQPHRAAVSCSNAVPQLARCMLTISLVRGMHSYLGTPPAVRNAAPGVNLRLDDGFLCQSLRKSRPGEREGGRRVCRGAVSQPSERSPAKACHNPRMLRPDRMAVFCFALLCQLLVGGCAARPAAPPSVGVSGPICLDEQMVELPSGKMVFDLYLPTTATPAPLVVAAHGFARNKTYMSGWGWRLADEGFVVAVPTLPAGSNHRRNGRAINELIA